MSTPAGAHRCHLRRPEPEPSPTGCRGKGPNRRATRLERVSSLFKINRVHSSAAQQLKEKRRREGGRGRGREGVKGKEREGGAKEGGGRCLMVNKTQNHAFAE